MGRDCETKFAPSGDAVTSFSVAVKSGYGEKESTIWANCAIWGKRGESVAPYLLKGQLVGLVGELNVREYDKKDGTKGHSVDVRVNDLTLLGKKDSTGAPAQSAHSEAKANAYQPQPDDDGIPF